MAKALGEAAQRAVRQKIENRPRFRFQRVDR
jgi:hypothetical protein